MARANHGFALSRWRWWFCAEVGLFPNVISACSGHRAGKGLEGCSRPPEGRREKSQVQRAAVPPARLLTLFLCCNNPRTDAISVPFLRLFLFFIFLSFLFCLDKLPSLSCLPSHPAVSAVIPEPPTSRPSSSHPALVISRTTFDGRRQRRANDRPRANVNWECRTEPPYPPPRSPPITRQRTT